MDLEQTESLTCVPKTYKEKSRFPRVAQPPFPTPCPYSPRGLEHTSPHSFLLTFIFAIPPNFLENMSSFSPNLFLNSCNEGLLRTEQQSHGRHHAGFWEDSRMQKRQEPCPHCLLASFPVFIVTSSKQNVSYHLFNS